MAFLKCVSHYRVLPGVIVYSLVAATASHAQSPGADTEACLLNELSGAEDSVSVGELRSRCRATVESSDRSLILERLEREQAQESLGAILTPYKQNYLMPVTYVNTTNGAPFEDELAESVFEDNLSHLEAKFQISLKFKLAEGLLNDDQLFFGFTSLSFWQAWNTDASAQFRETNYEPEIVWVTPIAWHPFDVDATVLGIGFSHQSNGRGGSLSRSWNRLYLNLNVEQGNFVFALKPWWRIPEQEKQDRFDATGDDNPDIEEYLGHFEFTTIYTYGNQELSLLLRNNLRSDNKGAVQLDWTFPMWRHIRGYAQFFNGYGESLIDYDISVQRIGIGFLLTNRL